MNSSVQQKSYELGEVSLSDKPKEGNGYTSNNQFHSNDENKNRAGASCFSVFTIGLIIFVTFTTLVVSFINLGFLTGIFRIVRPVTQVFNAVNAKIYHFDLTKQYYAHSVDRPPGFEGMSWQDTVKAARGKTVKFWMWSGAPHINSWVDGWLAPQMLSHFGVTVERVPQGAPLAVQQVKSEVAANPDKEGTVDLIWINGNNFKNLKNDNNAYGPWANLVPNSKNFDFSAPSVKYDFGLATDGYEFPYNLAQCVFIYNTVTVASPPMTVPAIVSWIKANPGKFTYSDPTSDFLGEAFVKHIFQHYAGPYSDLTGPFDEAKYTARASAVWNILNEIEPFLKKNTSSGVIYPAKHETIRQYFADGDVWLDISYDPTYAAAQILNNKWPSTTKSYLLSSGTISNTNFLAIPKNSGKKAAAMVTANFVGQMESMFVRNQPGVWGALQAFDPAAKHIVDSGWDTPFNYIEKHASTPSVEDLARNRISELGNDYNARIKADWETFVKNA